MPGDRIDYISKNKIRWTLNENLGIWIRIEGDEEKVKAELLASLKEVVSKMLPENMRDSSVSLAKLDEMEKKLSSGYTSFWS
jgi:hypothetical protein